jgi:hypothetical protein
LRQCFCRVSNKLRNKNQELLYQTGLKIKVAFISQNKKKSQ